jgi:hypothetical protein
MPLPGMVLESLTVTSTATTMLSKLDGAYIGMMHFGLEVEFFLG